MTIFKGQLLNLFEPEPSMFPTKFVADTKRALRNLSIPSEPARNE